MKICYILTELANGGAERVVFDLASYFIANNHEVTLLSIEPIDYENPMYLEFKSLNIRILSLDLSKKKIFNIFQISKLINQYEFDVIHSHLFHGNILSRFIKRDKSKCKLINTVHIMEYRKLAFWRFFIDRITFNRCDIHTAVALATAKFHAKKLHITSNKIKVIKNGIKLVDELSNEQLNDFKNQYNLNGFDKIIGSVGRLDFQKGYDQLLTLANDIADEIPVNQKWLLLIIGEGIERAKLMKLAENSPKNLEINLIGFHKNANQLNKLFDLFLMPSRSEGYPLTLLEVMHNGVPVLVNNISCVIETLDDYPNGEIIDFFNDNPQEIAKKIIANASKKHIEYSKITTISEMAENYKKIY